MMIDFNCSRAPMNEKEVKMWELIVFMAPKRPWKEIAEFNMSLYELWAPAYKYWRNFKKINQNKRRI